MGRGLFDVGDVGAGALDGQVADDVVGARLQVAGAAGVAEVAGAVVAVDVHHAGGLRGQAGLHGAGGGERGNGRQTADQQSTFHRKDSCNSRIDFQEELTHHTPFMNESKRVGCISAVAHQSFIL